MRCLTLLGIAALFASGAAQSADVVGRALIVEGVAQVHRGAGDLPIRTGSMIEAGDLVKVGEDSSLQIRFTDNTLAAMRANTEFLVKDYKYTATGEGDSSVFELVRGGLRTITGLIGKRKPDNFHLVTPTATIGIRGTNLSALSCSGDCMNADGTKAPDGVYGGVTEGRIVVSNAQGAIELSKDEYFYAANNNTKPTQLLGPPDFLRDKLAGRVRTEQKQVALTTTTPKAAGTSGETTTTSSGGTSTDTSSATGGNTSTGSGTTSTSSSSTTTSSGSSADTVSVAVGTSVDTTTTPAPTVVGTPTLSAAAGGSTTPTYSPASTPVVQEAIVPINFTETYGLLIAHSGMFTDSPPCSQGNCGTGPFANQDSLPTQTFTFQNYLFPKGTDPAYIAMQTQPDLNYRLNATQYSVSEATLTQTPGTPGTFSIVKAAATNVGSASTGDGTVTWGIYHITETATGGTTDNNYINDNYEHFLDTPSVTSLPSSGVFTFTPIGGTPPTDQNGAHGTVTNAGSWSVNFGSNTIVSVAPVSWTMPSGSHYTVDVTTPQSFVTTVTPYGTSPGVSGLEGSSGSNTANLQITNFTTCGGSNCMIGFAQLGPLVGSHFLGTAITTNAVLNGGSNQETTAQIRVYGR